jgi:plastocyanin
MTVLKLVFIPIILMVSISWAAETVTINVKSAGYDPKEITIIQGQYITWRNTTQTNISATSEDKNFDTGIILPGTESKLIFFKNPGVHKYHSLRDTKMTGTVIVKADH